MLTMLWNFSAFLRGYLRSSMPTNRAVDWLRTSSGLKWAVPVAAVATPAYLYAMSICATLIERDGPGSLNCLVAVFAWNSIKLASMGLQALVRLATMRLARSSRLGS